MTSRDNINSIFGSPSSINFYTSLDDEDECKTAAQIERQVGQMTDLSNNSENKQREAELIKNGGLGEFLFIFLLLYS